MSVESILSEDRVDTPWLLKTLDKEHAAKSLPKDVYEAVKQKVMDATNGTMEEIRERSAPEEGRGDIESEDLSRTQMATSLLASDVGDSSITTESNGSGGSSSLLADSYDPEMPIKGVGDVLNDRFVLEEQVGSGGMSTVFRAIDRRKLEADDRDPYIAVKILNMEFRAHPDSLIALQREAKKCHKLAHPNIVRAYDFDRDGATVYMTMEYLTGHSLAKVLRDPGFKGMSFDKALPIIRGMSEALSYAHKNGIVHADFKPANVILTDKGEVKVIDFGIARAFQQQGDSDTEATRFDPGSLGALTPTYASPEMLEHQNPDPRDDVYALACIVYEILTGRHPFGRRQANEARDGGLSLQRKTLSRRQWRVLKSALQFEREKRTPSIAKFFADINPEFARTPILVVILASMFLTALLIGIGAFVYDNHGFVSVETSDSAVEESLLSEIEEPDIPIKEKVETIEPGQAPAVEESVATPEPATVPPMPVSAPAVPIDDTTILKSVERITAEYGCSALRPSVNGGKVSVSGYLAGSAEATGLSGVLKSIPGVKSVSLDIALLTQSMCGVLTAYRPYWIANQVNGYGTGITPGKPGGEFVGGEPLVVKLQTPNYDSFVNVDYFSKDGHVVHMVPSLHVRENQAPANYTATLGDLGQWVISEPYGRELVAVITSPVDLFPDLREEYETTADYLNALEEKLSGIEDESVKSRVAVDFVIIQTSAK